MRLASRTRPKLGRTINSCVFFPTQWLLSRFVSRSGPENCDIFLSGGRMAGFAPGVSAAKPPDHPEPSGRSIRVNAIGMGLRIGTFCPKSPTGLTDTLL
jgi:hypothetical protein